MQPDDFQYYQKLLHDKSGLALSAEKTYLLETRLTPLAQSLGYATLDEMTVALRKQSDMALQRAVIEAMTTNETSFFRDNKPFVQLKDIILPYLKERNAAKKVIRIWSAACSTGQEPYSVAMIADEFMAQNPGWRIEIVATDISMDILKRAEDGEYTQFEIQRGLPIQLMIKYFTQVGTNWRIKDQLKQMIKFKYLNLIDSAYNLGGPFDLIFCRNVLIYFNANTKMHVLNTMSRQLAQSGLLMLGSCETTLGLDVSLQAFQDIHGIYALKNSA